MAKQLTFPHRNKHMVVERREGTPLTQIKLKSSIRGPMERDQPALTEFSESNDKPIGRDVLKPKIDRLGKSHARAC